MPINYKLYDHPRTDRTGGGTALLYNDSLHLKKIGAGQKESFEFSEWIVQQPSSHNIRVVTLCSTTLFRCAQRAINIFQFSELADYLESKVLCKEQLLVWGDFDIHVDIAVGADAIKLIDWPQAPRLCESWLDFEFIRRECMKIYKVPPKFHYFTKIGIEMTHVVFLFCYHLSLCF